MLQSTSTLYLFSDCNVHFTILLLESFHFNKKNKRLFFRVAFGFKTYPNADYRNVVLIIQLISAHGETAVLVGKYQNLKIVCKESSSEL